ncbi:metal-dependent transcriptional regulator [Clostridium merdae]|uniref:metal-dependent transcriptional regulator n=1 Tax=Clostridium merdae TaxID=1958780 RepID=UPI000A26B854|nr:metal-dependent transcriptional regulator [Clostridium merdae]
MGKKISPSKEEYLKAIYRLSEQTKFVRSIDLADYLGVTKPSVHHAVTALQEEGLVIKPLHGEICLTQEGEKQGQILSAKFQLLRQLLIDCCNVNEQTASADACKMEHLISEETTFALKNLLDRIEGASAHYKFEK